MAEMTMEQSQIANNINTLFAPYGLCVNELIIGVQSLRYKLNLPLDISVQSKIKRAESAIRYSLSTALQTNEFTYGHDTDNVYVELKNDNFKPIEFAKIDKRYLHTGKLNLMLGVDPEGEILYTDLSKAPHILIGGTTGSGKSELIHTFVASIVETIPYTGAEMIIIDAKKAEYSQYAGLNRIVLETEPESGLYQLNWAVDEMERRYDKLQSQGVKDASQYNGDMHPIVIIIDELADLIQQYPEVEKPIVRIAQKARACAIHLIIGTQSPRASIVTGLIKANMPTRIALKTKSEMESRIILDQSGAKNLYGKGDMLFLGNGNFSPIRIQGAYVSEDYKKEIALKLGKYEPRIEPQAKSTAKKFCYVFASLFCHIMAVGTGLALFMYIWEHSLTFLNLIECLFSLIFFIPMGVHGWHCAYPKETATIKPKKNETITDTTTNSISASDYIIMHNADMM